MRVFLLLSLFVANTNSFSVISCARKSLRLQATVAAKEEKLTKEAQELLDAFAVRDAKKDADDKPLVIAQVAPAVRVAIGEEFGLPPNGLVPGKLVAALRKLGFDLVLDVNVAADLTICEEGTELLHRLQAKDPNEYDMPLFTSCCPGWMTFVEKSVPEVAPSISTCKSPHMMYGAVIKEHKNELFGNDNIYLTSVMPCVKKRGESDRACFVREDGIRDVDNVITTKDLAVLLRMKSIDPSTLEPELFDSPFQTSDGAGTGAGQLFGATGGVMEAAVRSVYELVVGKELPRIEVDAVRGLEGVKEAVIPLYDEETGKGMKIDLRIAVVNGLGNAKQLVKKIKEGEVKYDFVEVMACPSGCINGGGQPKGGDVQARLDTIYAMDRALPRRKSHENPIVQELYDEFFDGEMGGHEAHRLLHVKPVYGGVQELKP